jgi:hypothetical protein
MCAPSHAVKQQVVTVVRDTAALLLRCHSTEMRVTKRQEPSSDAAIADTTVSQLPGSILLLLHQCLVMAMSNTVRITASYDDGRR